MRRWKSQMALLLSGAMAVTGIAPAGGFASMAAEPFTKASYTGYAGNSTPSNADKASPSEAEKATPSELLKRNQRFFEEGSIKYLRLSDLKNSHSDWGTWLEDHTVGGQAGVNGGSITLNMPGGIKTFSKGLAANSKAYAEIDVSGYQEQYFFAIAGSEPGSRTCTFKVLTSKDDTDKEDKNWEVQWYSNGVLSGQDEAKEVLVKIPKGATTLRLEIGDGGDGVSNDHGIWACASIIPDKETVNAMAETVISAPYYLKIDQEGYISAEAFSISGKKIDSEKITITAESDDEGIVAVEEDNGHCKLIGTGDGAATVTVTVEADGMTEAKEFKVIVGQGDENTWRAESPDGTQILMFFMNNENGVDYIAIKDDEAVINQSTTGLKTNLGDFTSGLTAVDQTVTDKTDSYDLVGAKTSHVENEYKELTLSFEKEEEEYTAEYEIVARVYDDGFALRYRIPSAGDAEEVNISEEMTSFVLPQGSTAYAMDYAGPHEKVPVKKTLSQLDSNYSMPLLYQSEEGTWGLISEAALNGSYCGGMVKGGGDGTLDVKFAPEQKTDVVAELPFESPWRFEVVGDARAINENTMAENLSPECQIEDTSWIEPGVTAWTWLNRDSTSDFDTYKRYIDLAVEMGWKYVLMDEGWQLGGRNADPNKYWERDEKGRYHRKFRDWTDELIAYADEKGVGLLAWAYKGDFDTEEKREALEIWAEKGIKGIKIDFFDSQHQDIMKLYDDLMEKTAECHLLLNPHGANKPSGERRTWPQSLAREGIFGAEQNRENGRYFNLTAEYHCMIPFIRNAVGPADYTPLLSYNLGRPAVYSISQMAALSIVFECGIPCLADKPAVYRESPAKGLLTGLPAYWDESHMLEGDPGKYVSIARKERNSDNWYVGCICDAERDAEVDLSFLDEGETYYAVIYKDGKTMSDIDIEMKTVTSEDVLTVPLAKAGGASIKITKEAPKHPENITLSVEEMTLTEGETETITAEVTPEDTGFDYVIWTSSNEEVATVKDGRVTAVRPGNAVITASAGFDGSVSASCNVTVTWQKFQLDQDRWTIRNNNPERWKLNSETSLTITSEQGEFGTKDVNAKNVFFMDANGDFTASVKLDFEPGENYKSGGFVIYANDQAVLEVLRRYHGGQGGRIFAVVRIEDNKYYEVNRAADELTGQAIYLKVKREGKFCTGYYSSDNKTWTQIGQPVENKAFDMADLKIGLYAVNGGNGGDNGIPATFEDLTFTQGEVSSVIPFAKAADDEMEQLKVDLAELIHSSKTYEEEIYTEDSFAALEEAVEAAKEALGTEDKEDIKACYEALKAAVEGLVTKEIEEIRTELGALIDSCAKYEEALYTETSFAALKDAVKAAEDALAAEAAKDTLIVCYNALKEAVKELVTKEEIELEKLRADLTALIDSCEQYEGDAYTGSSYAALKLAVQAAEDALAREESREILASRYDSLKTAIDGLTKREDTGDKELEKLKADLAGLIGSCAQYEEKSYTNNSFTALKEAMTAAWNVLADENSTKADIAECYEKLLKAVSNLEKVKEHNSSSGGGSGSGNSHIPSTTSESTWVQDANGWWIRNRDGSYPKEQWFGMSENGRTVWYYFDVNGYMKDGWLNDNGGTYFLHNIADGTRGAMYTGWHMIEGKWYYFEVKEGADQGKMLKDCITPDGFQLDTNGVWIQ